MPSTILLRRDVDLAGRVLRFDFTVSVEVPIDADFLNDAETATLEDVERWLGTSREASDALYAALRNSHYEWDVADHTVHVVGFEPRFERVWERDRRLAGKPYEWQRWVELPPLETCRRCESDLIGGLCSDVTCPYSDRVQTAAWTEG